MDLELRKAALEATGYKVVAGAANRYWRVVGPNGEQYGTVYDDAGPEAAWQFAPEIEDSSGVSEPWFLEWCEKNEVCWQIQTCEPHGEHTGLHYVAWLHDHSDMDIEAEGLTPSEARAKAVVEASKVKHNVTPAGLYN